MRETLREAAECRCTCQESCRAGRPDCPSGPHCRSCGLPFMSALATPPVPAGPVDDEPCARCGVWRRFHGQGEVQGPEYSRDHSWVAPVPAGDERLDNAYRERNAVVAALIRTNGWKASLTPAPDADGWWIVYAETPKGQVSWHISPVDIRLFDGIPVEYAKWDGHTTDEKYERVAALAAGVRLTEGGCDLTCGHSGEHWQADPEERP